MPNDVPDSIKALAVRLETAVSANTAMAVPASARVASHAVVTGAALRWRSAWPGGMALAAVGTESRRPAMARAGSDRRPMRPRPIPGARIGPTIEGVIDALHAASQPAVPARFVTDGGKDVWRTRKATDFGHVIDGAFKLRDLLERRAHARFQHQHKELTAGMDLPFQEVSTLARDVRTQVERPLKHVNLDEVRTGGRHRRAYRAALADFIRIPPAARLAVAGALAGFARHCFRARLSVAREAMLEVAAAAAVARAYALFLRQRARAPEDNAALGWPGYEGVVLTDQRRKGFTRDALHFDSLFGDLVELERRLADAFDAATDFEAFYAADDG